MCADVLWRDRSVSDNFVTPTPQSEHYIVISAEENYKLFSCFDGSLLFITHPVVCGSVAALQLLLYAINKPCKTLMTTFIPNSEGHSENI